MIALLFALFAQLPPELAPIPSPACQSSSHQTVEAALASGCYRLWPAPKMDDAARRQYREWWALWQQAQTLSQGHYAARRATPDELAISGGVPAGQAPSANLGWQGTGSKDTETFTTPVSEWRIVWAARSESRVGGVLNIHVHDAASRQMVASLNSGDIQGQRSDTSHVRVPPGRYYLSIGSANVQWKIVIDWR